LRLNIKYENNSKITDEEIWELRKSVGWDNNCYPFSKTKKNHIFILQSELKTN